MKVYFIAGLGADKRVFRNIILPEGFEMVHLNWLTPAQGESLSGYARRLAASINMNEPWSVIGLSFGGMLATEITRHFKPSQTILIASIPSASHLPRYYKLAAPLKLHKFLPVGLFKNASLAKRFFTTETLEDKALIRKIIAETDPAFIRWALGAILEWNNTEVPEGIYHIHGTKDRLLPFRNVYPTHIITGGGHLLVMNRANEVNELLKEILLKGVS
jgi:pimeloyl-ACP methyl ester carboxylesterase